VSGDALYHDALVSLARAAAGAGRLEAPGATATRDNPLCGDRVTFEVLLAGGRIAAVAHRVRGCVLCQAAASFLGQRAPGASAAEVAGARTQVAALLAGGTLPSAGWPGLEVFAPVRAVKSRHGCVLLPFDALGEALAGGEG
jgi:nitrogen fixation NifU-like protein